MDRLNRFFCLKSLRDPYRIVLGSPSTEKYEESGNFFFQFTEKEKHRALKNVS